jgi:Mrp family chromosome partitioning ATPase
MARAVEQRAARTAPSLGEYARTIWRRRPLVAAGLLLGLLLGMVVLPEVRPVQSTYEATIRLKVVELVSDTIVPKRPQFDTSRSNLGGGGDALRDVKLAGRVLDRLGRTAADLKAGEAVARLRATPVSRSPFVDLAYTDTDPTRARDVVDTYARAWAAERNALDARRLRTASAGIDEQIAELQQRLTALDAATTPNGPRPELNRIQARLDGLVKLQDDILKQQLFLGEPTQVLGSPVLNQLTSPTPRGLMLVLGLLIGLLIGTGCALLLEAVRPSVLAPVDAERLTGIQVIASVPRAGARGGLPALRRPFSPAAEGYRRVAGALERRGLGGAIQTVSILSPNPGEGRSQLAANLAYSLARQGQDVVLISADLRRPGLGSLMDVEEEPGLAEWLEQGTSDRPLPLQQVADHLFVLPAGSTDRSPGELLTAARLRRGLEPLIAAGFIVLIDTPPAHWSAEAMTLAAVADATLLVARTRTSRWRSIEQLAESLRRDGVQELGMVLLGDGRRFSLKRLRRKPYGPGRAGRHQLGVRNEPVVLPVVPPLVPPVVPPLRPGRRATTSEEGQQSGMQASPEYGALDPFFGPATSEHGITQRDG